jgi:hypothetical protein
MRRISPLSWLLMLGVGLVGWAAVAGAQQFPSQPGQAVPQPAAQPVQYPAPVPVPAPVTAVNDRVPRVPVAAPVSPAMPAVPGGTAPAPAAAPTPAPGSTEPLAGEAEVAIPDSGNPNNRQEPAVSIEWVGPSAAKVGQINECAVVVRNTCKIAVQQVMVRCRISRGTSIVDTEPKAVSEDNVLMWELGTMLPKQEKQLQVRLTAPAKGDVSAQAWVTFTGATAMKIKVREPKLVLKAGAPEKTMVGDAATFMLSVHNPGDCIVEMVKLHADLSDGLEHARGNKLHYEVGNLAPGETRTVQVVCITKTGGEQTCVCSADADGGIKAQDKASLNVVMPKIGLEVKGPKLRYLDRKAVYTFKVTNPGDAPATNVTVADAVPPGFKFVSADNGGRHDFATRTVTWFVGEVPPGESREVNLEVMCVNTGDFAHKVTAHASRNLMAEGELITRVEGLSAVMIELVDLEDPIEVGGNEVYEIRVTNTGSKTEADVKLACTVPDKMQFVSATGPCPFTVTGNEIVFEALPKLAPRADAVFRVTCKATGAGVVHFKSRITSAILTEPVLKEEATRIYAD